MSMLFHSYEGILQSLGQSQVLRYLKRLVSDNKIVLISFERLHDWQQAQWCNY